jgi:hypothetical protein
LVSYWNFKEKSNYKRVSFNSGPLYSGLYPRYFGACCRQKTNVSKPFPSFVPPPFLHSISNNFIFNRMIKVQDKLAKSVECLEYFTTHQWKFHSDNVMALLDALDDKDRQQFQFDVRTIQWDDYVEKYVLGFRQFLFKQNPSSLEDSRKRMSK